MAKGTNIQTILFIESNRSQRELYKRIFQADGNTIAEAASLSEARHAMQMSKVFAVVLNVNLPDGNGIDFIPELKKIAPDVYIFVFTELGNLEDGIRAMKAGANEYLIKTTGHQKLLQVVRQASQSSEEANQLFGVTSKSFDAIIGQSEVIQKAKAIGLKVAGIKANILLQGETGVGKDIFAQAIHGASDRFRQPFLAVNCSAIGQEILESELFGYKAGAFTGAVRDKRGLFEVADKGTIFLDEIAEMSINLQAKILRVLESGTFIKLGDTKTVQTDCRLITATHVNLIDAVRSGLFREDLYHRISAFVIHIPPLRHRDGDIELLGRYYLSKLSKEMNIKSPTVSNRFFNALERYPWKGNVRELINVIQRCLIMSDGQLDEDNEQLPRFEKSQMPERLADFEIYHIRRIMEDCKGNKRLAARRLGISIATLYRKLNGGR